MFQKLNFRYQISNLVWCDDRLEEIRRRARDEIAEKISHLPNTVERHDYYTEMNVNVIVASHEEFHERVQIEAMSVVRRLNMNSLTESVVKAENVIPKEELLLALDGLLPTPGAGDSIMVSGIYDSGYKDGRDATLSLIAARIQQLKSKL